MNQNQKNLSEEPETLTISRAALVLGWHRNKVRNLIDKGFFKGRKIGSRVYLLRDELIETLKK